MPIGLPASLEVLERITPIRGPMSDRIVTNEDIAKALDWLRDSAMALGQSEGSRH